MRVERPVFMDRRRKIKFLAALRSTIPAQEIKSILNWISGLGYSFPIRYRYTDIFCAIAQIKRDNMLVSLGLGVPCSIPTQFLHSLTVMQSGAIPCRMANQANHGSSLQFASETAYAYALKWCHRRSGLRKPAKDCGGKEQSEKNGIPCF
jgi:hypothetical protein